MNNKISLLKEGYIDEILMDDFANVKCHLFISSMTISFIFVKGREVKSIIFVKEMQVLKTY